MSSLTLTGTLSLGEGCGGTFGGGCSGSASDTTISLGFGACPKSAAKAFHVPSGAPRSVNSPGSFVTLEGVPTTVTHGEFLWLQSNAAIVLELTNDDGIGGSTVQTADVQGLVLLEFPPAKFLKLLRVKGVASIAYLVTGPS